MFCVPPLDRVHVLHTGLVDRPGVVAANNVSGAREHEQFGAGYSRGPDAREHDLRGAQFFADQLEGVGQSRQRYYGCAVLVVVKNGDIQLRLQTGLNFEASGRGDVFKVDTPKPGGEGFDRFHNAARIALGKADWECIYAAELPEQNGLALHHRQGRQGAYIP